MAVVEEVELEHQAADKQVGGGETGSAKVLTMEEFQKKITQQADGGQEADAEKARTKTNEGFGSSWKCAVVLTIGLIAAVIIIVVIAVTSVRRDVGQGTDNPSPPYRHAAVVTDVDVCSTMGKGILERGGSAVDSAITAQLCVGLVNSQSSGLGGGFFMMVYRAQDGSSNFLDAREVAPAAADQSYVDFMQSATSAYGINLTGIPGEVMGLWNAHEMYGKLAWGDLLTPVIDLAEQGYVVTDHLDITLQSMVQVQTLTNYTGTWDIYMKEDGSPKRKGDVVYNQALANTLKAIAENGPQEFYTGQTASTMVQEIQSFGGIITLEDLASYSTKWSPVLSSPFGDDLTLLAPSMPSGGPVLQFIINVMQSFNLTREDFDTVEARVLTYHRFIEACKFAFGLRSHLGETESPQVNNALDLLSSMEYAHTVAASIPSDGVSFTNVSYYLVAPAVSSTLGGTSHISVLAENGDAVSLTSSVNYRFGSRVRSSTGLVYNNQLADFSLSQSSANYLVPGKRPLSSMSGSVVVGRDGRVKMVEGSAGSTRIITANAWVLLSVLLGEVPLSQAVDERRIHCYLTPEVRIDVEEDFPQAVRTGLASLGHDIGDTSYFSVVEAIVRQDDGFLQAYSDPRKQPGRPAGY